MRPIALLAFAAFLAPLGAQKPVLPAQAGNSADWMEPFAPFRIADNLYYVGTRGLANYLITTPAGHILINSDLEENVPQIRSSVEKLGFKFSDVKILVINHAHWDHDAGSATIKKLTGATYAVMEGDVSVVESGGKTDFHYGADTVLRYAPAKVDRVLHDGDAVTLGGTTLVAHLTPGHTKGNTTWTMKVTDGGKTYDVVIVGSWNVNGGYKLVNNTAYPTIAEDYDKTFRVLHSLPCDLFLGAHGSYFGMDAKVAKMKAGGPNPFVDPEGYSRAVTEREKAFRGELAKQRGAGVFTLDQVTSYPFPNELTAARTANRIAWAVNEAGVRNLYMAEGPGFAARRVTSYTGDDAQELTSVQLTPNGAQIVYVRGGDHGSNWDDALPVNPAAATTPVRVQVWSVPFTGGEPKLLGDGDSPVVSPRGDVVAFERGGQVWVAPVDGSAPEKMLFSARGNNGDVVWSPDGSRLAFVSSRGDHAFIGVYTSASAPIAWIAPSTSRDASPRWSPDGARVAFIRRPGAGGSPQNILEQRPTTWAIWTANVAMTEGTMLWTSPNTLRGSVPSTDGSTNLHWAAADRITFLSYMDGWPHLYSVAASGGPPLLLTPGAFQVENVKLTNDGRALVYAANAGSTRDDGERRHVFIVPVDRAEPRALTAGPGIESYPILLGDATTVAYLSATVQRPAVPAVRSIGGGAATYVGLDRIPADFPAAQLVTPKPVTFTAEDGVVVHGQLFEPVNTLGGTTGERKPAILYVHGGPQRQMLLGWHPLDYYANGYAMNQYLASRGFVVLSVNYRLGVGYGYEFHQAPAAGARGASEYLDVKAAGLYLKSMQNVDPARIGVYGGSYGGFLTALALGRNSDLFAAGVDIHGVHDFTSDGSGAGSALAAAMSGSGRFEPNDREKALEVAWKSSPVSSVPTWKSPVLFIHGDDDRNVRFSQTVDLVRRIAAKGIEYEELVIVDDTHHFMRHANQLRVNAAIAAYLEKKLSRVHVP